MQTALLLAFSLLMATGQILFKKSALAIGEGQLIPGIFNVWSFWAVAIYVAATVLWIAILRTTPLSTAYPFVALGFVVVPIASRYLFNEQLTTLYLVGAALIICGIVLTSR